MMNWLGDEIQKHIESTDTVLDLGCGIMQATSSMITKGRLKCKSLVGAELFDEYVHLIKYHYPVLKMDVSNIDELSVFVENSFDVVLCIDVLEHLEESNARMLINKMKSITRKKVIVYTPKEFETNEENAEAWGMGANSLQIHRSLLDKDALENLGFEVTTPRKYKRHLLGIRKYSKESANNLGVWQKVKDSEHT